MKIDVLSPMNANHRKTLGHFLPTPGSQCRSNDLVSFDCITVPLTAYKDQAYICRWCVHVDHKIMPEDVTKFRKLSYAQHLSVLLAHFGIV
jgi:hypothetical protein